MFPFPHRPRDSGQPEAAQETQRERDFLSIFTSFQSCAHAISKRNDENVKQARWGEREEKMEWEVEAVHQEVSIMERVS